MPRISPIRRAALFTLVAVAVASPLASPARAQTLNPNLWVPNGAVNAVATVNDTAFIGGSFTRVAPVCGGGVPLEAATGIAATGFPRIHGNVYVVVPDGANGWFIGGAFDSVGGMPRTNVARINANLSVNAWAPVVDDAVYSMVLSGTTLYLGGTFQVVNATPRPYLVSVSTSTAALTTFNPGPDGPVYSMALSGNTLFAGGPFSSIGGQLRTYLGAVDVTTNLATTWDPEPDGLVWSMAVISGVLYVGGDFTHVSLAFTIRNGAAAYTIATGALASWNPNILGTVYAMTPSGTTLYMGGFFSQVGNNTTRLNAVAVTTSGSITGWNPAAGDPNLGDAVQAIAVSGTTVYVGGSFNTVGGQPRRNLAAVDASTGAPLAFNPDMNKEVDGLAVGGTRVFAGGRFTSGGGVARTNLAALNLVTGTPTLWNPGCNAPVTAMAAGSDSTNTTSIYIGGAFTTVGASSRSNMAKIGLGSGVVSTWDAKVNGPVTAVAVAAGNVFISGNFNHFGSTTRNFLGAVTTGSAAPTVFVPVTNGPSNVILPITVGVYPVITGVLVGGSFTSPRQRLAFYNKQGQPLSFTANCDSTVYALSVIGNTLYVGGSFLNCAGQSRARLAAVDLQSGVLLPWDPSANRSVRALIATGNGVFAGGFFTTAGGLQRNGIAAIDLDGNALPWYPGGADSVRALRSYGNAVLMGGSFANVGGFPDAGFALIDAGVRPAAVPTVQPAGIALGPVAPNPFRTTARISFTLARPATVTLALYDIAGRRSRHLLSGVAMTPGRHDLPLSSDGLEPGVYFLRFEAGREVSTRKVVIAR